MASRLKIRIGNVEFEYEGDAEFTQESIKDLFTHMEALSGRSVGSPQVADPEEPPGIGKGSLPRIHTTTIAARMQVKSASDLAIASAAHLQLVLGKGTFSRQDLLDDMKSSPEYFKASMVNNLSGTIKTLCTNGTFNRVNNSEYSLMAAKRPELEKLLAE